MWWAEHVLMGLTFCGFAAWFLWGRNFLWLGAATLSQLPFWLGLAAFVFLGQRAPVEINMASNLIIAAIFIDWGHSLQRKNKGGIVQIWLCRIFVAAASFDVLQLLYPVPFYILAQELIHYCALAVIGGRAYVRRIDGRHRHHGNSRSSKKGGRLV